eukprot:6005986-Amphidinium_carterae.2
MARGHSYILYSRQRYMRRNANSKVEWCIRGSSLDISLGRIQHVRNGKTLESINPGFTPNITKQ